jgi:hypothetical protein
METVQFLFETIAPLAAREDTDDLSLQEGLVRFDRTVEGRIIIPGICFADGAERQAETLAMMGATEQSVLTSRFFSRNVEWLSTALPKDTPVSIVENDEGRQVEALPPGIKIPVRALVPDGATH